MANAKQPDPAAVRMQRSSFLASIGRPVSPPSRVQNARRRDPTPKISSPVSDDESLLPTRKKQRLELPSLAQRTSLSSATQKPIHTNNARRIIPSPFHLTKILDLPDSHNVDAITLHDLLGSPLIREAWIFNYCFDIDWTMQHFDVDIRDSISVKIIHGSWKTEDRNRQCIDNACRRLPNVEAIRAYLPDAFGTHHTKMIVLFSHDDTAQIIIHTANMQAEDWTHVTQAVWRSPQLQREALSPPASGPQNLRLGSGRRFKYDFLRYLAAYGKKLGGLVQEISKYDFTPIRGALIGSVPSKVKDVYGANTRNTWGHPALKHALNEIQRQMQTKSPKISKSRQLPSHIVCQCSSIATLKAGWLEKTLFHSMNDNLESTFSIIYPTVPDVGNSLDGYGCGGSIHLKITSAAHQKQVASIRPYLCRWTQGIKPETRYSRRDLAAPHIKTYISFKSEPTTANPAPVINWALLTSANLSTQAWGTDTMMQSVKGKKPKFDDTEAEVHIQSFELGVLVWPNLWADPENPEHSNGAAAGEECVMLPAFGRDLPENVLENPPVVVGLRMPYDLPLTPYTAKDVPWSPNVQYDQPDRYGRRWPPDDGW